MAWPTWWNFKRQVSGEDSKAGKGKRRGESAARRRDSVTIAMSALLGDLEDLVRDRSSGKKKYFCRTDGQTIDKEIETEMTEIER